MGVATPNQSYLAKQMQFKIAAALASGIMRDMGANVVENNSASPWNNQSRTLFWPTLWRKDHQGFKARQRDPEKGVPCPSIFFSAARWDSQYSDLIYGPKSIDQAVAEQDEGKTKIIHNDTDDPIHIAYEESVDLTNSFSSSITKGVTLDMTEEAGGEVSTTVKGEYAGVSAEASVSAHFGVSKSKGSSTEQGREQSEEGTRSESLAIDFDAAVRSYYLVEITKKNERTSQPFDIDGVMDFDMHLTFPLAKDPHEHNRYLGGIHDIDLAGIDALLQWVYGYDTDYPSMEGYWDRAWQYVKASIAWIENPENRRIQVSGIAHASLDSNVNYSVELLGNHVPDALAHLPVVNAVDV